MNLRAFDRKLAPPPLAIACGVLLWLLAASPAALAQDAGAQPAPPAAASPPPDVSAQRPALPEIGASTRAILAIQREGTQAGPMVPLSGEQAALGYERYLNSFRFALPEFYTGQANASTVRSGSAGQAFNGQ